MIFEEIAAKLETIQLEQIALQVVRDEIGVAINLNTEVQLYGKGIDAEGKSLGRYARSTIEQKKKKGQRFDHVTLHDTEDYINAWFASTDKFPVTFGSSDPKAPMIEDRYGGTFGIENNLYGLTKKNTNEFSEYTKPIIAEQASKKIREAFH